MSASDVGAAGVVQRDEPGSADAPPPATSGSRQSWVAHFEGLPEAERTLAYAFRSFPQPGTSSSLLASFGACMLLNLSVGAPYAANERTEGSPALQTAMRGLVGFCLVYHIIGPIFLVNAPTIVRGGFHPRYLLSVPIALAVAVAAAFIPTGDYPLGIVSIGVIALVLGFVFCVCLLNVPFFATDEYKALDQTFRSARPRHWCPLLLADRCTRLPDAQLCEHAHRVVAPHRMRRHPHHGAVRASPLLPEAVL